MRGPVTSFGLEERGSTTVSYTHLDVYKRQLVDTLRDEQKERHIERLSRGECNPAAGLVFIEIIDNLERISDHAENMAEYIMNEM